MSATISSDIGYYAVCSECDYVTEISTYVDACADADDHNDRYHGVDHPYDPDRN